MDHDVGNVQVAEIEEARTARERERIVVTEIPYMVNKARLLEKIAELVNAKTIPGIADLRDESDRQGLRVVIELRREAEPEVVLNQLFRYSPLQGSFGCNMLALNAGRPELLDLKAIISAFMDFREEVVTRRTAFRLGKARDRAHLLVGLAIAVANIDPVIELIRAAPDPLAAREGLMARRWPAQTVAPLIELIDEPGRQVEDDGTYQLSEAQARAILELRLQRLTGLERDKIAQELEEIAAEIKGYLEILGSRERLLEVLRGELIDMKERFATPRRTELAEAGFDEANPLSFSVKYRLAGDRKQIMVAMQDMWRQIGVEAQLEGTEVKVVYADYRSRNFEVADAGWVADYDDPQNFLFLAQSDTGALNYADYNNPAYDALMEEASVTLDLEKRAGILAEAEAIMLADAPIAPIYFSVNRNLIGLHIQNWHDNVRGIQRTRWLKMDESKRKTY